jgi:Zn-finger nucleic acid-binding protein
MKCPSHKKTNLEKAVFYNTEVDYCPDGLGVWFDQGELRIAKDSKEENLDWIDVDLWEDKSKFKISKEEKICPNCGVPMYEISYDNSEIKIDICNVCMGVWLDRGEFKKIMEYLRSKVSEEIMENYTKRLLEETAEVFTGPESLEEEVSDVLTVIGLFKYKFSAKHPVIADIVSNLPRS